jgi:hypothetical protein
MPVCSHRPCPAGLVPHLRHRRLLHRAEARPGRTGSSRSTPASATRYSTPSLQLARRGEADPRRVARGATTPATRTRRSGCCRRLASRRPGGRRPGSGRRREGGPRNGGPVSRSAAPRPRRTRTIAFTFAALPSMLVLRRHGTRRYPARRVASGRLYWPNETATVVRPRHAPELRAALPAGCRPASGRDAIPGALTERSELPGAVVVSVGDPVAGVLLPEFDQLRGEVAGEEEVAEQLPARCVGGAPTNRPRRERSRERHRPRTPA